MKKLISLDVWNTLITFNPAIRIPRTELLAKLLGVDKVQVDVAYQAIKRSSDKVAEFGENRSQEELYVDLIKFSGATTDVSWETVRNTVEDNFREFPPYIHPELPHVMKSLSERGYGLVIASNNNFISGEVIRETVLNLLGVKFEFAMFSETLRCAKPGKEFMVQFCNLVRVCGYWESDTVHIGDNEVCDNFTPYGIKTIIINNPSDCINTLKREFLK